jgi:hypothetical protein
MRLTWLPAVLRGAGLTVHEYAGWRTRGSTSWGPIRGITCHHTAGSRNSTDADELRVLVKGSLSAPPPIAQLYLSRSGQWWVVASGCCNHNLVGWGGPNEGLGNSQLIGIEAQHSGGTEPWTEVQYRSYVRGVAALVRHLEVPVSRVAGHKEHQPGAKSDPTFNMDAFRAAVRAVLEGDDDMDQSTFNSLLYTALKDPRVAARMKQLPWQYQDEDQPSAHNIVIAKDGPLRTLHGKLDAVLAAMGGVDEEVLAKLGAAEMTPEQIADVLGPVLGHRAEAVGQALQG